MSNKKDAEYYLDKLETLLKDELNERINQVNILKNDEVTLRRIDDNAYYYLTFGESVPAYDPCIVFNVETEPTGEMGGLTSETLRVVIELVTSDRGELKSLNLFKTLQRYRRAVFEILIDNQRKFPNMQLVSLPDVSFTVDDGFFYACGVGMECSYTS